MAAAVIFDCDGVLFESSRANIAYYNAIRAAMALPPMDAEWERRAQVLSAPQLLEAMFGADPALLDAARRTARAIDYGPFYALMVPAPGLYELLADLRTSYRLGMATNRGSTVGEIVRRFGLERYLHAAVGVLDVARPKPHPDVIHECLSRLGVATGAAVYVGDAESDRQAAAAAGVQFVAVGAGAGAGSTVRELRELPAVLRALALSA